jgi:predicted permease
VTGTVVPLQQTLVGDRRRALVILLGATGLLLLIACANVTNLLLSQAALRRREIAVRTMMGASRRRIVRQLLVESVVLAMVGAAVGLVLAPVGLGLMRALMPADLAGVAPAQIDFRVLGFAALLALATGIAFGLWPAIGSTGVGVSDAMRSGGGHGATRSGARRVRRVLVTVEIALSLLLLIGAGLLLRSFRHLIGLDSGMRTARVGTLELSLARGVGRAARLGRIERIQERLAAQQGIEAVGVVNDLPLRGGSGISIGIKTDHSARPKGPDGYVIFPRFLEASSGYFRALGIPLLRGRLFAASDDSLGPSVAVISASMAMAFWPDNYAIGRVFYFGGDTAPTTVIGIVGDVREASLDRDPTPQMYFPVSIMTPDNLAVVARSTLPPAALLARMTDAVRAVDPAQAVYRVRMLQDVVRASVAPRRANTVLISAFAGLALVLAVLGVYAVVAYGVAQRARELGIRAALGATGRDLVQLLVGEMVPVTLAGITLGLGAAWALTRVLSSLIYGVSLHDALTFVVVPIVLAIPALVASLLPARRAMRVNPVDVIRAE